jgi:hypothetical protein
LKSQQAIDKQKAAHGEVSRWLNDPAHKKLHQQALTHLATWRSLSLYHLT